MTNVIGDTDMPEIDPTLLETDPEKGLALEEVEARQKQFGFNRIETKEASWFSRLFRHFWGPIPWMIEVAAILSASMQRWEDFILIIIMLLVNAFADFYQESKALSAIAVLKLKLALQALVKHDGEWRMCCPHSHCFRYL